MERPRRRWYLLFGVLAALVGTAVGHLIAAVLRPDSSPILVVGSTVIDLTPTPLKEWAIRTFESDGFSLGPVDFAARNYDKTVLVGSVFVGVLALAGLAGLLARRRLTHGAALLAGLVAVPLVTALTRPDPAVIDVVPSLGAAVAGVGALVLLVRAAAPAPEPAEVTGTTSRRRLMLVSGGLLGLAVVAGGAGRWLIGYRSRPEDVVLPRPAAGEAAPPLPRGLEARVDGVSPLQVPNSDFYRVDTRLDTPVVNSEDWSLTIDGDVREKVRLDFDELLAMPMVERDITLTCVSNSVGGAYVGGARWLGVPLTDVLDLAGVGTKADQILSTDFDGMTISTPLAVATDGRDALVAVGMNGSPLPREHGFPVRLVIPGLYGFISATKWLTRLTLTTYAAEEAYWTRRGWATDAPIKPSARIDTPRALAELDAGEVIVGGVAWAQNDDGVGRIEVQVDGGPWQRAKLGPDLGSNAWRQWYYAWEALPGRHLLKARVVAADGDVQTAVRAEPFPSGSSGIHSVTVEVRRNGG